MKLGISICRLSTQFHINTVLDRAKNCLFELIFHDRNMLMSLSSLLAVLPVLDQCIFVSCHPSIRDGVLRSGMLLYLHHRNSKLFFHPAKFDNFKDESANKIKAKCYSTPPSD